VSYQICPCGIPTPHAHPAPNPAPVDWPARFRAAAEVAERHGFIDVSDRIVDFVEWAELDQAPVRYAVEAIERALLGEPR
jgi:hypothetical protein